MIVQGRTLVEYSFESLQGSDNATIVLDDAQKKKIEKVLNDEFCNLDVTDQSQDNTCETQTLNFVVKKRICCGIFLKFSIQYFSKIFLSLEFMLNCKTIEYDYCILILMKGI